MVTGVARSLSGWLMTHPDTLLLVWRPPTPTGYLPRYAPARHFGHVRRFR